MPRPPLNVGDTWTAPIANASVNPQIDGQDEYGSIALIRDENFDPDPTQLFSRTKKYLDRVKVSIQNGLIVNYTGAFILSKGIVTNLSPGSLVLPASTTGAIFINSDAQVIFSSILPNECIPLALFTTNVNSILSLVDLRDKVLEQVTPIALPPTVSPFRVGDVKITLQPVLEAGWLRAGTFVSSLTYPALFSIFGYKYGQSGINFRLPGDDDLTFGFASNPDQLGAITGSNSVQLSQNNLPSHSHGVREIPHAHRLFEQAHSHNIIDLGHSHGINDPQHDHTASKHRTAALNSEENDGAGAEISLQGTGNLMPIAKSSTGITIRSGQSNINISPSQTGGFIESSATNISIQSTGNSQAFSVQNKHIKLYWLIKA